MSIDEASRTTLFLKYAKHNLKHTFAFEAKICKSPSLPFEAVVPHQIANLNQAKHSTLGFKIPDAGWQNPFDGFQLHNTPAYVIIFWYQKRDDRRMTIIDVDEFIKEKETSNRKSLTYDRSCEIGRCLSL